MRSVHKTCIYFIGIGTRRFNLMNDKADQIMSSLNKALTGVEKNLFFIFFNEKFLLKTCF